MIDINPNPENQQYEFYLTQEQIIILRSALDTYQGYYTFACYPTDKQLDELRFVLDNVRCYP